MYSLKIGLSEFEYILWKVSKSFVIIKFAFILSFKCSVNIQDDHLSFWAVLIKLLKI